MISQNNATMTLQDRFYQLGIDLHRNFRFQENLVFLRSGSGKPNHSGIVMSPWYMSASMWIKELRFSIFNKKVPDPAGTEKKFQETGSHSVPVLKSSAIALVGIYYIQIQLHFWFFMHFCSSFIFGRNKLNDEKIRTNKGKAPRCIRRVLSFP